MKKYYLLLLLLCITLLVTPVLGARQRIDIYPTDDYISKFRDDINFGENLDVYIHPGTYDFQLLEFYLGDNTRIIGDGPDLVHIKNLPIHCLYFPHQFTET